VVTTKDEETQQINEDVSIYSNYQLKTKKRSGRRFRSPRAQRTPAVQIFYDTCKFNPGFSTKSRQILLSKQGSQSPRQKEQELEATRA